MQFSTHSTPVSIYPLLLTLIIFVAGCTEDVTSVDCKPIWVLTRTQLTANYKVVGGELQMEVQNAERGVSIDISQEGLNGDFLITAGFDAFLAGTGDGGFAQMVVSNPLQPNSGICGASIGSDMTEAFVGFPNSNIASRFTNGSSGRFTVQRIGNQVTATCKVGDKTATKTADFITDDLTVSFQIGSTDATLIGTTTIRILEFTASDSSGVDSDDFECDKVGF